jgi:hypothetical protein
MILATFTSNVDERKGGLDPFFSESTTKMDKRSPLLCDVVKENSAYTDSDGDV